MADIIHRIGIKPPIAKYTPCYRGHRPNLSKPIATPSFSAPAPLLSDHMADLVPMS